MTTGERYCPECGALLHGEWCSQCGRKGIESLWGAMSWVEDVEPAPGTKGYISRERNKAIAERDEARNLVRWLWAACRELRQQRDEYLELARGFLDVARRSVNNTDMAILQRNHARAAALEEAARVCERCAMGFMADNPVPGGPRYARADQARFLAQRIRALMSSDDESDVTHES